MCIVICDYHGTFLVNNKSEWHVAMCQQFLLFYFFNVILENNLKCPFIYSQPTT
jgi:hypothetical protein